MELHLDFESRSPVSIEDVGLYNYIFNPQTQPLFLWYKINEYWGCWRIWEDPAFSENNWLGLAVPSKLDEALNNSKVMLVAFNSAFERYMLKKLGYEIPPERFIDPQVGGRYLSLPASLEAQCEILNVPESLGKMKRGKELIKMFSELTTTKAKKPTKKNPNGEPERQYYNDWNSHPAEWEEFLEYGRKDVIAEGELLRRQRLLGAMPLPEFEQRLWIFDQKVNDRGMPVDRVFVEKMYRLAIRAKEEAKKNFEAITGVQNANSPAQIKTWAALQGYPYPSLNKDTVTSALKDPNLKLTEVCRKALTMRREAASTSYQKLGKILNMLSSDNRLRNQFVFMGSSRCGRWAGNAVQLHNLARPIPLTGPDGTFFDFEDQKVVAEARQMIYKEDYEGIKTKYGSVLLVVKNLIRTVFVAPGNEHDL